MGRCGLTCPATRSLGTCRGRSTSPRSTQHPRFLRALCGRTRSMQRGFSSTALTAKGSTDDLTTARIQLWTGCRGTPWGGQGSQGGVFWGVGGQTTRRTQS
eukprot:Amastigsp_a10746_23.p4 type:complete len:101 gc:universal Amastigsp_a10746_23:848-546(-)